MNLVKHQPQNTFFPFLNSKEKIISDFEDKLQRKNQRLSEIINQTENNIDFEAYHNSEICQKILNRKPFDFTALSDGDLALLLESADRNLGNLTKRFKDKYPKSIRKKPQDNMGTIK